MMRPRHARYPDAPRYRTFRDPGCGWRALGWVFEFGQLALVAGVIGWLW